MEKLKYHLYFLVFIFTILSVSFALLSSGRQRDFYYIAIYLGIIGLIIEHKKLMFTRFNIAYPIILIGLIKIIWFFGLEYGQNGYNFYSDQINGGKKLVLGGMLVFYLTQCSHYLRSFDYKKIILLAIGAAFIAASYYAVWQVGHGMKRAEMGLDRATNTAYIYSTLSIFLIYSLYLQKRPTYYIFAALVIIISFIITILTGTRAAIIFHLLIIACMTIYYFKKIHFKSVVVILVLSTVVITVLYNNYIHPKIIQTYNEVALYQNGRDNTSLGARFSMWTVGLKNFAHAPLGQSFESRVDYSAQYVKENPQYKTAMRFISVHLHDELIETISLQGIFGGMALIWFYISISWAALKKRNTPLLFTMNCMIIYGLSDVLLLSSEAILFFVSLIAISGIMLTEKEKLS